MLVELFQPCRCVCLLNSFIFFPLLPGTFQVDVQHPHPCPILPSTFSPPCLALCFPWPPLSSNGGNRRSGNSKPGTVLSSTTSYTCTFTNVGGAFSTMQVCMPFELFHFFSLTPRDFLGECPTSSPPFHSAFNVLATMSGVVLSPAPTTAHDALHGTGHHALQHLSKHALWGPRGSIQCMCGCQLISCVLSPTHAATFTVARAVGAVVAASAQHQ